ncbi:hypothetical protein TH61_09175 [Rufibacter sp. DG15C]|uniref:hypothetical protein n=1 Tax=Rufibacter sp. DG15C TaxID=1379909 RepID=UPI00078B442C|nr:hypothetical protein [Rufibacter sp. DG15C]AMM51307.1 hypothetical protein TH61_09175 [Rufibacter sp. DG15C]
MKILNKYILGCLVLLSFGLTSCFEEEDKSYSGPTVVEFKNHTLGMTTAALRSKGVVQLTGLTQTDTSRVITAKQYSTGTPPVVTSARTVDTVLVQLVGPQRPTATEVSFEVLPTSTAVEGTDYTFDAMSANKKIVIAPNTSHGLILIKPISIPGTATKRIILRLKGSGDVAVSPNYDTFYLSIYQPQ